MADEALVIEPFPPYTYPSPAVADQSSTIVDVNFGFLGNVEAVDSYKMDFRLSVVQVHEAGWTYLD